MRCSRSYPATGESTRNNKPRRSGACVGAECVTACGARSRDQQRRGLAMRAWRAPALSSARRRGRSSQVRSPQAHSARQGRSRPSRRPSPIALQWRWAAACDGAFRRPKRKTPWRAAVALDHPLASISCNGADHPICPCASRSRKAHAMQRSSSARLVQALPST